MTSYYDFYFKFQGDKQCDQMDRLLFNIGPFITMEICPKVYQFTKDVIKFCQILI